jgi:oligo-alginate lyase
MITRNRLVNPKLIAAAAAFLVLFLMRPALAVAGEAHPPRTVRMLFIGNSYTYANDLPGLIAQLSSARGVKLEHESVTPGGATLEKQCSDGKAVAAIHKQTWDYVVLQEQSARPFRDREAMFKATRLLHTEIVKTGAKTLLYETWAAKVSPEEQSKLTDAYETLGRELGATVVPVGEAWKKAIAAGMDLHGSDGRHPNRRGSYLAACLFAAALTGENPVGLPNEGTTESKPWTIADAPALQRIAAETPVPGRPVAPPESAWQKLPPHPRLLANVARFEAIKSRTDEVSRQLLALLRFETEKKLATGTIKYPATGFLMGPAREAQGRILTLALSYRLTGEKQCFARAREELLRLADLPEWRPSHFLDVGEAALAAGIGYDWLYDDLSADDRDRVARAIVRNAILPSLAVPAGENSWVNGDFNWTQVCHGGVVVAALAISEREPSLARKVVERAVSNFDKVGAAYSPDGSYAEGPSYWSYGTSFHVILVEALRTALGTSCGLEKFPGFLKTCEYNNQMVGPTGDDFNFSDYHLENLNEPIMLWFARETRDRSLARDEFSDLARALEKLQTGGNAMPGKPVVLSRHLPLELLWWDPSLPAAQDSRRRHWTAAGVLPLGVMRSAWDDRNASFVAVKGGTPNHSHAHMDVGSFVFEADGVRWAVDLRTESYDKMRQGKLDLWNYTQNSSRWTTFRVGPEGHNILRFNGALQQVDGKAEIRALPDEEGSMGDLVELTPLYRDQVSRVERRIRLHPDRSITIDDQWTTGEKAAQATWQWLTRAQVAATTDGAVLNQAGQTLRLRITEGTGARIEVEDVSRQRQAWDSPNPNLRRILIHMLTPPESTGRLHVVAEPTRPQISP